MGVSFWGSHQPDPTQEQGQIWMEAGASPLMSTDMQVRWCRAGHTQPGLNLLDNLLCIPLGLNDSYRALDTFNPVFMGEIL